VRELVRSNDAVLISAVEALLDGAGIAHFPIDQNMSVLEEPLGILPRRVLVADMDAPAARRLLQEAGFGHELGPDVFYYPAGDVTEDAVLGGKLRLRQPRHGHRVGHDTILLAAATGARAGEHVVDLGAGTGAAGLALAARIPDLTVTLVEIDPALAALADENVRLNGLEGVTSVVLDIGAPPRAFAAAGLPPGSAAHVLMNPPFNDPARHRFSPDARRRRAHAAESETLAVWIKTANRLLQAQGILTMIWRADGLAGVLRALDGRFGNIAVLPVHPRPDEPAIRVLVRARKASRGPLTICPGLMLNDESGQPTPEAQAVLRDAAPLPLATGG
jgi:tRNA1(Val) A37 N6-methylase TrmN6